MGKRPVRRKRGPVSPSSSVPLPVATQSPKSSNSYDSTGQNPHVNLDNRAATIPSYAAKEAHQEKAAALDKGIAVLEQYLNLLRNLSISTKADGSSLSGTNAAPSIITSRDFNSKEVLSVMSDVIDECNRPSLEYVLGVLGTENVPKGLKEGQRNLGAQAFLTSIRNRLIREKHKPSQKANQTSPKSNDIAVTKNPQDVFQQSEKRAWAKQESSGDGVEAIHKEIYDSAACGDAALKSLPSPIDMTETSKSAIAKTSSNDKSIIRKTPHKSPTLNSDKGKDERDLDTGEIEGLQSQSVVASVSLPSNKPLPPGSEEEVAALQEKHLSVPLGASSSKLMGLNSCSNQHVLRSRGRDNILRVNDPNDEFGSDKLDPEKPNPTTPPSKNVKQTISPQCSSVGPEVSSSLGPDSGRSRTLSEPNSSNKGAKAVQETQIHSKKTFTEATEVPLMLSLGKQSHHDLDASTNSSPHLCKGAPRTKESHTSNTGIHEESLKGIISRSRLATGSNHSSAHSGIKDGEEGPHRTGHLKDSLVSNEVKTKVSDLQFPINPTEDAEEHEEHFMGPSTMPKSPAKGSGEKKRERPEIPRLEDNDERLLEKDTWPQVGNELSSKLPIIESHVQGSDKNILPSSSLHIKQAHTPHLSEHVSTLKSKVVLADPVSTEMTEISSIPPDQATVGTGSMLGKDAPEVITNLLKAEMESTTLQNASTPKLCSPGVSGRNDRMYAPDEALSASMSADLVQTKVQSKSHVENKQQNSSINICKREGGSDKNDDSAHKNSIKDEEIFFKKADLKILPGRKGHPQGDLKPSALTVFRPLPKAPKTAEVRTKASVNAIQSGVPVSRRRVSKFGDAPGANDTQLIEVPKKTITPDTRLSLSQDGRSDAGINPVLTKTEIANATHSLYSSVQPKTREGRSTPAEVAMAEEQQTTQQSKMNVKESSMLQPKPLSLTKNFESEPQSKVDKGPNSSDSSRELISKGGKLNLNKPHNTPSSQGAVVSTEKRRTAKAGSQGREALGSKVSKLERAASKRASTKQNDIGPDVARRRSRSKTFVYGSESTIDKGGHSHSENRSSTLLAPNTRWKKGNVKGDHSRSEQASAKSSKLLNISSNEQNAESDDEGDGSSKGGSDGEGNSKSDNEKGMIYARAEKTKVSDSASIGVLEGTLHDSNKANEDDKEKTVQMTNLSEIGGPETKQSIETLMLDSNTEPLKPSKIVVPGDDSDSSAIAPNRSSSHENVIVKDSCKNVVNRGQREEASNSFLQATKNDATFDGDASPMLKTLQSSSPPRTTIGNILSGAVSKSKGTDDRALARDKRVIKGKQVNQERKVSALDTGEYRQVGDAERKSSDLTNKEKGHFSDATNTKTTRTGLEGALAVKEKGQDNKEEIDDEPICSVNLDVSGLEDIFGDDDTSSKDSSELNPIGTGVGDEIQLGSSQPKANFTDSKPQDTELENTNNTVPKVLDEQEGNAVDSVKDKSEEVEVERRGSLRRGRSAPRGVEEVTLSSRRLRRESTNLRDAWGAVALGRALFGDDELMQDCVGIWAKVNQNKISIPFRDPVLARDAPNYFDIVREPMDLSSVRKALEEKKIDNPRKFYKYMMLICHNAMLYNDVESDIYGLALELSSLIRESTRPVVRKWIAKRQSEEGGTLSDSSLSSSSAPEEDEDDNKHDESGHGPGTGSRDGIQVSGTANEDEFALRKRKPKAVTEDDSISDEGKHDEDGEDNERGQRSQGQRLGRGSSRKRRSGGDHPVGRGRGGKRKDIRVDTVVVNTGRGRGGNRGRRGGRGGRRGAAVAASESSNRGGRRGQKRGRTEFSESRATAEESSGVENSKRRRVSGKRRRDRDED